MELTDESREWLQDRALRAAPLEACGFILESGEILEIRNVSQTPRRAFRMDREELVRELGTKDASDFITAIWHTHPGGTTVPSHTDLDGIKCGAVQRNWKYYIVTAYGVYEYEANHYAPQEETFWRKFSASA